MLKRALCRRGVPAALSVAVTLLTAASAHAAQFVATDVTYTHSATTTSDSHYRVDPSAQTPASWTAPVDYANGSAHVRLEVRSKPNMTTQTCFQVCFEATTNYGCTDISRPYTTLGVYEWDTPFSRFFTPGPVSWNTGVRKVALLLKDTMNGKPAPENVGAATSALYMPTDVHVTVTIVSAGSTYQAPAGDGGTTDPVTRPDADVPDARRNVRDASAADTSTPPAASDAATATTPPPTETSPPAEAAAPPPAATTPPTTGQAGGAGSSTPAPASSSAPTEPADPGDGGGCSITRSSNPHPSSHVPMLASAVALALAASRRRRVIAPRAKRKACL
jgi:MYXO-CTERM domain-containing protein